MLKINLKNLCVFKSMIYQLMQLIQSPLNFCLCPFESEDDQHKKFFSFVNYIFLIDLNLK